VGKFEERLDDNSHPNKVTFITSGFERHGRSHDKISFV